MDVFDNSMQCIYMLSSQAIFFLPYTSGRRGGEVGLILRERNLRGFLSSKNKTEWMIFLFQFDNSERCQTNSDFLDIKTYFTVEFSQGLLMIIADFFIQLYLKRLEESAHDV